MDIARHVYPRCCNMDDKLARIRPAFTKLLMEYIDWPLNQAPKEVTVCTNEYLSEQDGVSAFLEEMVGKTDDNKDRITLAALWEGYRSYCADNDRKASEKKKGFFARMHKFVGETLSGGDKSFIAVSNSSCNIY